MTAKAQAWDQPWKCEYCFAVAWGPVHGEGNPCPQKIAVDDAYIAAQEALRMSHLRGSNSQETMAAAFKKAFGLEDDE